MGDKYWEGDDQDVSNETEDKGFKEQTTQCELRRPVELVPNLVSKLRLKCHSISTTRDLVKFIPSFVLALVLVAFIVSYGPILLEHPETITPTEETYSLEHSIGIGEHESNGYHFEDSAETAPYRAVLFASCSPQGDYLSTGKRFNCQYNASVVGMGGERELITFNRDFLDRVHAKPLLIAKWERLSAESETVYVTEYYGYSSSPTLNRTFKVYTPTQPGEYRFSLLISSYLNPVGPEHQNASVVLTRSSTVYVYSEEQAASFRISVATYRLQQVVVVGILIAILQLLVSVYPSRRE